MILNDLKYKAECFYGNGSAKFVLRVIFSDGAAAMILYRIACWFRKAHLGAVGAVISEINKYLHGCILGRGMEFGGGFVLNHPIGVVINGAVKGGERVVIESGVVIGTARQGFPVKVPSLGNDIYIGAGAKILGEIRIGNNVKIAANAVVTKDVNDNETVAGIPARVIVAKPM
jgi:serine O-acetyltransferase